MIKNEKNLIWFINQIMPCSRYTKLEEVEVGDLYYCVKYTKEKLEALQAVVSEAEIKKYGK